MVLLLIATVQAQAECVIVRERDVDRPTPHLALHFGSPADVPRSIVCSTSLDKNLPTMCIPIYAYNLWDGADGFRFGIATPQPPQGFDRGPDVVVLQMKVDTVNATTITSLDLATSSPVCGPVLLGCLRLATAGLPESFRITMVDHESAGPTAVRSSTGDWWAAAVDRGGAHVGAGMSCSDAICAPNQAISMLRASQGERAAIIDLEWECGSGNYTLLRYRTDGRHPADPWDGELMAFLPSNVSRYSYSTPVPGELRIAGWSITRNKHGDFIAASSVECGSLTSIHIQLPVSTVPSHWGVMKSLYR